MKASNLILFSTIGSITLLIITGSFQLRFSKEGDVAELEVWKEKMELPHFQHLVINDVKTYMAISSGEKGEIELTIDKESSLPKVNFHTHGDTLYIESFELKSNYRSFSFTLYLPNEKLNWIQCSNSRMGIENYKDTALTLRCDNSHVTINSKNNIRDLKIDGQMASHIEAYDDQLNTLHLTLDDSEATIHSSVTTLQGTMKNNSSLSVKEVDDFQFKKDKSSRFNHWN